MSEKKHRHSAFGRIIKLELLKRDMTNREFAKSIGIKESTLSDVIRGRNLSVTTKTKIVEALQLPGTVLLLKDEESLPLEWGVNHDTK